MIEIKYTGKTVGVNARMKQGKGRWYKNPEYKAFQTALFYEIKRCMETIILNPITVTIRMITKHDIDNLIKPILDTLELAGVMANDKQISLLIVNRVQKIGNGPDELLIKVVERRSKF